MRVLDRPGNYPTVEKYLRTKPMSRLRNPLTILLIVYSIYASGFIFNMSLPVDGKRYFLLFDDAMISMRYARNLVNGEGLVWNPGREKVEGITNPLWTGMMATTHLLPLPLRMRGMPILILAALILLVNIAVVHRIALLLSDGNKMAAMLAAVFTAFFFPLNHWSFLGMEVSLMTLLASVSVLYAVWVVRKGANPAILYILISIATLVRIDAVVWGVAILGFLWWADPEGKKHHLLAGGGMLVAAVLLQTVLRAWYYGDILPNTYYLKMTGYPFLLRIARGFVVTFNQASNLAGPLLVIAGVALIRMDKMLYLPLSVYCSLVAYSVYVGGDAWEWWGEVNRYVTAGVPMLFVVFAVCVPTAWGWIREKYSRKFSRRGVVVGGWIVLASLLILANKRGEWKQMKEIVFLKQPLQVEEHTRILQTSLMLDSILTKDARVAVVWAGIAPYVLEREAIDMLGKNDRRIARMPMQVPPTGATIHSFYPGHMKYDYAYSVGKLKPDAVVGLWKQWEEAKAVMGKDYVRLATSSISVYLRKTSGTVRWENVGKIASEEGRP